MRYFIFLATLLATSSTWALPASSPNGITNGISQGELMRVLMGLMVVLLTIILLSWVVKRLNLVTLSSAKGFQSIATMALGTKEKITLIKVGECYLLLGVGAGNITMLHDFGNELPVGFEPTGKPTFSELFKSALVKK